MSVGALSIYCFEVLGVSACFGAAREWPFYGNFWSVAVRLDDDFLLLLLDVYSVTRRYAVDEGAAGIGAAMTLEATIADVFFLLVVAVVLVES